MIAIYFIQSKSILKTTIHFYSVHTWNLEFELHSCARTGRGYATLGLILEWHINLCECNPDSVTWMNNCMVIQNGIIDFYYLSYNTTDSPNSASTLTFTSKMTLMEPRQLYFMTIF